jgi:NAD(P)-dependent dehydrogenase (short-subunit alcohol dehydrogenase family)
MDISGKTAIVTGAASGIGLGIATALAEAGANVVMADIQKDVVEQAAHGLSGTNKRVMPVRIDVTQEQSIIDALAEAERNFGKLHIACNNAGVPMHGTRMIDVPPSDWEFVIGVNIWGSSTASATSSPPSSGTGKKGMLLTRLPSPGSRIGAAPTRGRIR